MLLQRLDAVISVQGGSWKGQPPGLSARLEVDGQLQDAVDADRDTWGRGPSAVQAQAAAVEFDVDDEDGL